jgi:putative ABC transport system ATP-binding protein
VALARAFAPNPRILFADEPTANLDAHTGEHIADLLFRLQESSDTVLILVTHDEMLARRCDRRLHLRDGILEADT